MNANIDWDFISIMEGKAIKTGYHPSQNSGVTIGTGFDLKERTEENIGEFGFSNSLIQKISPFFQLTGAEASEKAPSLQLNDDEVAELDSKSKAYYTSLIANKYEQDSGKSFYDLSKEKQTVIASVGFQYGSFSRTPNFWKAVTNDDWEAVENELRNFGDAFSTRRNNEADYLIGKKKVENLLSQDTGVRKAKRKKIVYEKKEPEPIEGVDVKRELKIDDGELYLDKLYKTFNNFNLQNTAPTLGEGAKAAISENFISANVARALTFPTFESDGFSFSKDEEFIKKRFAEEKIRPEFYDEFSGVVSKEHFEATILRVKEYQDRRDILDSLGWKGVALEVGSFFLDPVTWLGYGAATKVLSPVLMSTRLTRLEKFKRAGSVYAGTEAVLFSPVVLENPTYGTSDLIIAAALGGTLGGGASAIFTKNLNNIAKAELLQDIEESGHKLTTKGEKEFKNVKKPLNTKLLEETVDVTEDVGLIKDIRLMFPKVRDLPFLFLAPFTRSGALGTSKSEVVRLFNFLGMEEPVGYTFKEGTKRAGQVAPQDDTVELIKNQVIQGGHNLVYQDVLPALKGYLREQGHNIFGQFVAIRAKKRFMLEVAEVIRNPNSPLASNKHIAKAAQAYRTGFRYMVDQIKRSGIDVPSDFKYFDQYLPRKISQERFGQLVDRIGYDGVVQLVEQAILRTQPRLNDSATAVVRKPDTIKVPSQKPLKERLKKINSTVKDLTAKIKELKKKKPKATAVKSLAKYNARLEKLSKELEGLKNERLDLDEAIKRGDVEDLTVKANKAQVLARAIVKAAQNVNRGAFDIEKLVRFSDVEELRAYLDEVMPEEHLSAIKESVLKDFADNIDLITSGRLESRIRLDETFETTIKGQKVRFDDLLENDVDYLWHSYMNEMSGWIALGSRMNLKNRKDLLKYKNKLNQSIDEAYGNKKDRFKAKEEKKTIDSFFKNILGRSAEDDPTDFTSTSLRNLRKFNFMRVLNQVGIAQLPEFGMATAQQGFTTLVQEIPHLKSLLVKAQKGELDDTFFQELAELGSANGTEYLARAVTTSDIEDIGQTAVGRSVEDSGYGEKIHGVSAVGERATGYFSGLFLIDSMQRRLTMRLFVNRMAKDLIDVAESGKSLDKLGKRLNRYRVLGFTDEELLEIAKEFGGKNVITEKTALGRRVKQFNFSQWKNQDLVQKFARRTNRYTQRAVQYNYLGDTNRFFTDTGLGKTLGQFRSFIMTAWSKQFLHNLALADFSTFATFSYTMLIGGLAYVGQTHMNTIGMSKDEKRKYLKKKLGDVDAGDYSKISMAAFQRAGWSSLIPPMMDLPLSAFAPEHRFNFRTSGLEVNLWTGNPTYDLFTGTGRTLLAIGKSARKDYEFSRKDLNRMLRLLPFQNMYGVNNILNYIRDNSGLPPDGTRNRL